MVEITYQMVLSTLQTLSIIAAILYYTLTLRNSNRTQQQAIESRNTQFLIQLYNSSGWQEDIELVFVEKTWDTFDEWWDLNGATNNPDAFARWLKMMVIYEVYGLLVKRGFLDIDIVDDLMSGLILMIWDRYRPIIEGFRERYGYPQFQEHQEYLANEIRKIVNKQHPDFEGKRQT